MKPMLRALFAIGLCGTVTSTSVTASAAPKTTAASELRVSKEKASAICRDVEASPDFKKAARVALEKKSLSLAQSGNIAGEICRFYAATPKSRARYWERSLATLVEQGKLTKADKKLLTQALTNPKVLATWKPTTDFGRRVLANAPDDDGTTSYDANSGAGWVVGGIIGGIAGGIMTGGNPAGIGAGIAVGGAAGSLAETVFTSDDDGGGEEDGEGDGDGGGGNSK